MSQSCIACYNLEFKGIVYTTIRFLKSKLTKFQACIYFKTIYGTDDKGKLVNKHCFFPFKAEDFSKLKDKIKRGCRLRPGQIFCPSRREMLPDLFKAMPPPQLAETYAQPKRANPVENEEKRTTKCPDGTRPRPGSLWCPKPGKRDIAV